MSGLTRYDAYGLDLGCGPPILSLVQSRATVDAALMAWGWSLGVHPNEGPRLGLAHNVAAWGAGVATLRNAPLD